jgi:hypothetical protein
MAFFTRLKNGQGSPVFSCGLSLLAVGALALALDAWLAGGFTVHLAGFTFRSNLILRPILAGLVALAGRIALGGWRLHRVEAALLNQVNRLASPPRLASVVAMLTIVVGLRTNFGVASGADAYGYISQADLWIKGQLTVPQEWVAPAPWPEAIWTSTPLGYGPAVTGAAIVPVYAPGLPLLMAGAKLVAGQCAVAWVVPLCGGWLVWLTYLIGKRVASPSVGAAAAWIVATSPTALFMLSVPMSDVPAAAAVALATLGCLSESLSGATLGGLGMTVALLIRPQLAFLVVVFSGWLVLHSASLPRSRRLARLAVFVVASLPGIVTVAVINKHLYGSPTRSGYGDLGVLFSSLNVLANARHYAAWLTGSQTPLMLAGALALCVPARWLAKHQGITSRACLVATSATVVGLYLFYRPFDAWWFLRFLLPCWPAMAIGTAWLVTGRTGRSYGAVGLTLLAVVGARNLAYARDHFAFEAGEADLRYASVAHLVQTMTEPDSVILSMQHSGSVRYYGGRLTLRYDLLDPKWLDPLVAWFDARHVHTYILLDDWEVDRFRKRFQGSVAGRLTPSQLMLSHLVVTPTFLYDADPRSSVAPLEIQRLDPFATRCSAPSPMFSR